MKEGEGRKRRNDGRQCLPGGEGEKRTSGTETRLDDVGDGTSGEDVALKGVNAVKARTLPLVAHDQKRASVFIRDILGVLHAV